MAQKKIHRIPQGLLELYKARLISSAELASQVGMNASYLRRAIEREKREPPMSKKPLIAARKEYRKAISHKSVTEIMSLAHVSKRTAQRIRAQHAQTDTLAPKAQHENEPADNHL